jgi:hypothetical protein
MTRQAGYRVDLRLCTGSWIPYTSRTALIDEDFAASLFRGLQRQGAAARVIKITDGAETIIQESEDMQ